jgi:hypothetical protein
MATVTINIPDAVLTRVTTAFTSTRVYNPLTDGTPAQFTKSVVVNFIKSVVVEYEGVVAANTAKATATTDIALS